MAESAEQSIVGEYFNPAPPEPAGEPAEAEYETPAIEAEYDDERDDDEDYFDGMVDDAVDANLGTALADPEFQAEYEAQRQAEDEVSRAQTNMEAQELVGEMTRRSGLGTRFDPATTLEVGNRYLENVQTVLRAEGYDEQQIEELTGTPEFSEAIVAEVLEARRIDAVKERALSIVGRRP